MTRIKNNSKIKSFFIRLILILVVLCVICGLTLALLNYHVIESTGSVTYSLEDFESSDVSREHYDAVIVLGCAVWSNGPSPMLADRLRTAAAVYKTGCADYVLVSGDSEYPEDYDETGAMKAFLIEEGVPEADIKCDPLGLSTYETAMRSAYLFDIDSAVVVTTEFHVARSVYDCRAFGIESVGVEAINSGYVIQPYNYCREFVARGKDFVFAIIKPGA
jgi:vancomycin permeability regulator SanA